VLLKKLPRHLASAGHHRLTGAFPVKKSHHKPEAEALFQNAAKTGKKDLLVPVQADRDQRITTGFILMGYLFRQNNKCMTSRHPHRGDLYRLFAQRSGVCHQSRFGLKTIRPAERRSL